MNLCRAVFIFLISISLLTACSNRVKEKTPEDLSAEFLTLYQQKGSNALYFFFENNRFAPEKDANDYAVKKLDTLTSSLGNYRGYELITRNVVARDSVILSYMIKYDRQPVRFNLYYYRPNKQWLPYYYSFDTELSKELDKSGELYFLNKTYNSK